jgi:hypothetical protein
MLHRALQDRLVQVMPAPLAGEPIHIHAGRREYPLPHPLSTRIRVFPSEGRRKLDPAGSGLKVSAMLRPHGLQMTSEIRLYRGWQHRHSVLVTLAAPHDERGAPCERDREGVAGVVRLRGP